LNCFSDLKKPEAGSDMILEALGSLSIFSFFFWGGGLFARFQQEVIHAGLTSKITRLNPNLIFKETMSDVSVKALSYKFLFSVFQSKKMSYGSETKIAEWNF